MNKYICALDIETTGLDKDTCEILELSIVKYDRSTNEIVASKHYYIKPLDENYTIDESAQELHGITKEMISDNGVYLLSVSSEIQNILNDSDILTYNGNRFDLPILARHFENAGINIDFSNINCYDSYIIEKNLHTNKLNDVYKRYTGNDIDSAHSAMQDTLATLRIFVEQSKLCDIDEFVNEKEIPLRITFTEDFFESKNDELIFKKGKYAGKELFNVALTDKSYIKWLYEKQILNKFGLKYITEYITKRAKSVKK